MWSSPALLGVVNIWPYALQVSTFLITAGPGYRSDEVFDLSNMQPYTIDTLLEPFRKLTDNIALYLPRTSDLRQLASRVHGDGKTTVVHYCLDGASKVSVVRFEERNLF